MAEYKASMFNRLLKKDGDMILYNSKTGPYGIRRVEKSNQEKVERYLNNPNVVDDYDDIYLNLVKFGFLVPFEVNEKQIREYYQTQYLTNPRLYLVIHTSRECNFRCTYCYMDFKHENIHESTKEGIVNFISKNIQNYKSVHISWFGGEPLLGIDAIEDISKKVMTICEKAKKPYSASITTNGYLLTPKNIDILLKSKVRNFFITIDGTKSFHDEQRVLKDGSGTFDTIIGNLLYIKNNIKTRALNISIRSNMTKHHMSNLAAYYEFYDSYFGDDDRFTIYAKAVGDYGGTRVKKIKSDLLGGMQNIYDNLAQVNGRIKFMWNINDLSVGSSACPSREYNKFTIGCDGAVHKCDEDMQDHPVGHLYPDGKMELFENEHAKWVSFRYRPQCDDCFFSMVCFMEGCPKARIFHNVNICEVDFEEVDSLIWWTAKLVNAEFL